MRKLIALFVSAAILWTSGLAHAGCEKDDLYCYKRLALDRGEQLESLARELGFANQLVASKEQTIRTLDLALSAMKEGVDATKPALKAAERHWYEAPVLWLGAGVLFGIGLACLSVWAIGQAAR